jgi:hypothetical protein
LKNNHSFVFQEKISSSSTILKELKLKPFKVYSALSSGTILTASNRMCVLFCQRLRNWHPKFWCSGCFKFNFWVCTFVKQLSNIPNPQDLRFQIFFLIDGKKIWKMAMFFQQKLNFPLFYQNLIKIIFSKNSKRTWLSKVWTNRKWPETMTSRPGIPVDYRQKSRIFTWPLWSPETTNSGFSFLRALI